MNAQVKAIVPALALATALALPSAAEAGQHHAPRRGHRGYSAHRDDSRGHYATRPYGYSYRYRSYRPGYYSRGYGYAPAPYAYGYYGYGYDPYYPPLPYPPPAYRRLRPRFGVSLYFGF